MTNIRDSVIVQRIQLNFGDFGDKRNFSYGDQSVPLSLKCVIKLHSFPLGNKNIIQLNMAQIIPAFLKS